MIPLQIVIKYQFDPVLLASYPLALGERGDAVSRTLESQDRSCSRDSHTLFFFFSIAHQTISRLNHGTAFSIVDRYTWSSSLSLPAMASLDLEARLFASVYRLHTKDMVC